MFDAAPDQSGSRVFIATAALAVGLLTGFAGGYVTGQRHESGVPSNPAGKAVDEATSVAAPEATDVPAQSYTENPVAQAPEVVATAEVEAPTARRASTAQPAVQPRRGALFVVSRPTGAEVFLDERLVGTTPLSLSDVPAGTHAVRIALPDHQRWATSVTVTPGVSERVAASLER